MSENTEKKLGERTFFLFESLRGQIVTATHARECVSCHKALKEADGLSNEVAALEAENDKLRSALLALGHDVSAGVDGLLKALSPAPSPISSRWGWCGRATGHDGFCDRRAPVPCDPCLKLTLNDPPSPTPSGQVPEMEAECCEHAGKPNVMDAEGGPRCHCGRPSARESGVCAPCARATPKSIRGPGIPGGDGYGMVYRPTLEVAPNKRDALKDAIEFAHLLRKEISDHSGDEESGQHDEDCWACWVDGLGASLADVEGGQILDRNAIRLAKAELAEAQKLVDAKDKTISEMVKAEQKLGEQIVELLKKQDRGPLTHRAVMALAALDGLLASGVLRELDGKDHRENLGAEAGGNSVVANGRDIESAVAAVANAERIRLWRERLGIRSRRREGEGNG